MMNVALSTEVDIDAPEVEPYQKPSRAVVARGDHGGCVVWCSDDSMIEFEISASGNQLDDLGLGDAPEGISIWEGEYAYRTYDTANGIEHYTEPVGVFRPPTAEEWVAIMAGMNPLCV